MLLNQRDMLNQLELVNIGMIEEFKQEYLPMSAEDLNRKPSEKSWSILETFEHIRKANRTYVEQFDRILNEPAKKDEAPELFKPAFFGLKFYQMMRPKGDKIPNKMQTMKKMRPDTELGILSEFDKDKVLADMLIELERFNTYFQNAQGRNLKKYKISAAVPLVSFNLGDALRFMGAHTERHMLQAKNVKNSL